MSRRGPELPTSYEDLLSGYYGLRHRRRGQPETLQAVRRATQVVTLSVDDGELLAQTGGAKPAYDEYVVDTTRTVGPLPAPAAPAPAAPASPAAPMPIAPMTPPTPTTGAITPAPAPPGRAQSAVSTAPPLPSAQSAAGLAPNPGPPAQTPPPAASQTSSGSVNEDELAADMKAILSGQSVYDPATGRTMPRGQPSAPAAASSTAPARTATPDGPPSPTGNGHAIFDAIAQSMQYANAYDLGSVDLDGRFDDFDRLSDLQQRGRGAQDRDADRDRDPDRDHDPDRDSYRDPDAFGSSDTAGPPVKTADFLQDMDAIRGAAVDRVHASLQTMAEAIGSGMAHATCLPSAVALAASAPTPLAEPMYDTGEHALAAADIYSTPLTVGAAPGVAFTYAQIVTMPDLYESVEQMIGARDAELVRVKTLIERSTGHYRDGSAADVTDTEWQEATGGRYLDLAERNYSHFAPDVLFGDAIATGGTHHTNHKETWESHHRRALQEARSAAGAPPAHAMIVNAFGDHFLTDAFAAGHLINKDAIANYFKHNFLSAGHLTAPANAFFDRVAQRAFVGPVAARFSQLETAERPHWYVPFHPNINSADRFATLLKMSCEAQPDKVANLAVKAVHDSLNAHGIDVSNDAGDPNWQLTGDGHLTQQTRVIMQRAVHASVANLTDPTLRAADDAACFARVWRFTPRLIATSRPMVVSLVQEFTNPASTRLSNAAADLITSEVDQLIHVLVDQEHKLRPA